MKAPLVVICLVLALGGRVWAHLSADPPLPPVVMTPIYEESPFLWFGKRYWGDPPEVSASVIAWFRDIPARYPSAASCGFDPAAPIGQIPWPENLDKKEFEVCMFRILSKLGSVEAGEAWLVASGWRREAVVENPSRTIARLSGSDGPLTRFYYRWDATAKGLPYRAAGWFQKRATRTVALVVERDAGRGIISVSSSSTGPWSK